MVEPQSYGSGIGQAESQGAPNSLPTRLAPTLGAWSLSHQPPPCLSPAGSLGSKSQKSQSGRKVSRTERCGRPERRGAGCLGARATRGWALQPCQDLLPSSSLSQAKPVTHPLQIPEGLRVSEGGEWPWDLAWIPHPALLGSAVHPGLLLGMGGCLCLHFKPHSGFTSI